MKPEIDLTSPAFFEDPYPAFRRMRESAPVFWSEQWRRWVLMRYDDVVAALRDTRRFSSNVVPRLGRPAERAVLGPFLEAVPKWMFFLDPPRHAPTRAPYVPPFNVGWPGALRALVRRRVDELLDRVASNGEFDVIRDLACPLPSGILAELLCPAEDCEEVAAWSRHLAWASARAGDAEARRRGLDASLALAKYFGRLVAGRDARPGGPLFQGLLEQHSARGRGSALDADDLAAQCVLMVCAGNETTQHTIGNGLLALLRHPDQLRQLRDDPDAVPNAVDELLRYDAPVQSVTRLAREDVELRGRRIREGDEIVLVLAAANRDPARFAEPDRLDLRREEGAHVAFGYGPHYCLGASLARLEASIALRTLLCRFPALRLAPGPLQWRTHDPALRGLKTLPVLC